MRFLLIKMNYDDLLKKAQKELPENIEFKERFEVPKVKGSVQGNKTFVTNFLVICDKLGRKPTHLLKYLQKELATPAKIDGRILVFGRKLSSSMINAKIKKYTNEFVLCNKCKKADTKIIKEGDSFVLKCTACGEKTPIKVKI